MRSDRKQMLSRPLLGAVMLAALLAAAIACGDDGDDQPPEPTATSTPEVAAPGPTTFEVRAGDAEGVVTVNAFLPEEITVREGDTVRWTFPSPEIHTVTFLGGAEAQPVIVPIDGGPPVQINPAVAFAAGDPSAFDGSELLNSGILPSEDPPADTFETTFAAAGTYGYVCLIHPRMTGAVTVVTADTQVAAPNAAGLEGEAQFEAHLVEGQEAADGLAAASTENADGTTSWTMPMGVTTEHTDVLAFLPDNLEIGVGDTVRWVNASEAPHTASFSADGTYPDFIVPEPQDTGPPVLAINFQVAEGVPATEPPVPVDGTTYVNSGILGPPPEFQAQEWTAQFTAPGTFQYVCIIHLPNGMRGTVTVTER
jgi:plastocyanin